VIWAHYVIVATAVHTQTTREARLLNPAATPRNNTSGLLQPVYGCIAGMVPSVESVDDSGTRTVRRI
jgi:hypothetical protein